MICLSPRLLVCLYLDKDFLGFIREHSQISTDCHGALIDRREIISLPRNLKMVGVNMHVYVPVVACVRVCGVCACVSVCCFSL